MRLGTLLLVGGVILTAAVPAARAHPGAELRPRPFAPVQAVPAPYPAPEAAAASAASVATLRRDLERLLRVPGWRGDRWGVLVTSLDRGDTLFALGAHEPLAPASNMKLFTSAAALYYLGPTFRFNTFLLSDGALADGVLHGDLVVYGTGDPTLSHRFHGSRTAVWEAFADSLAALGVREIRGDLVGDGSYFTGPGEGAGWHAGYMNASYAASAGALSANDNLVTIQVLPGQQPGWRPRVRPVPGGDAVPVMNQATTVARGATTIQVERVAYDGPIVVRGRIARGSRAVWRQVPVPDPALYTAAVFREALAARGIEVTGGVRSIRDRERSPVTGRSVFAPAFQEQAPLRVLAMRRSEPLQQVLEVINKRSHNMYSEQVLRAIGRVAVGIGSTEAGARAIHHMLQRERNVAAERLVIADGSGLSALNRADAGTLVALLDYMADSEMFADYWETLPEAGSPGGLRRMERTAAERNLRAKTGTINRVSALSGYVRAANGERLAFAILSNDVPSTWRAKRVEDGIGARLAAFDRPWLEGLELSPAAPAGQ
jgi:serine-type D-Ala-D-Ala carboxypeptidase/endopeptidase (penicillin-binding protein 4)